MKNEEGRIKKVEDGGCNLSLRGQHGFNFVGTKALCEILRQAFVEENAHLSWLKGFLQHGGGLFEIGNGLLAGNRGELLQKIFQRIAALNVINQRSHGNAGANKARSAAHDFGVNLYDRPFLHWDN